VLLFYTPNGNSTGHEVINVQQVMLNHLAQNTFYLQDFDLSAAELPLLCKFLQCKTVRYCCTIRMLSLLCRVRLLCFLITT